ncbi:methyltransferase [Pseudonocardia sp. C8]|uniref:methyltransferase n=1 Tax=Pseudonocardia sp. C8 TaxID=2762759 RepID=UPI001642D911|nr:methyltransferase [Pseudonocardia sp. C8]MBC3193036.1 methyltransferase [Pseudonocardia sp. C8]
MDTAASRLIGMVQAHWITDTLCAAAELGVLDVLAHGPAGTEKMAAETDTHAPTMDRLLRALAALGLVTRGADGWASTELGDALQRDAPGGAHARALLTSRLWRPLWDDLTESVRTGEQACRRVTGRPIFAHLEHRPELGALYDVTQRGLVDEAGAAFVDAYDVPDGSTVVDLGGGTGALLRHVLAARPACRGILLDLPHVAQRAHDELVAAGVGNRCDVMLGDFFESVPGGADVYLLSFVLHDWTDDECRALLRNVRVATPPEARVLVLEQVLPDDAPGEPGPVLYDLHMLVGTGGRERTAAEYTELLDDAGFRVEAVVPTAGPRSVIDARPR